MKHLTPLALYKLHTILIIHSINATISKNTVNIQFPSLSAHSETTHDIHTHTSWHNQNTTCNIIHWLQNPHVRSTSSSPHKPNTPQLSAPVYLSKATTLNYLRQIANIYNYLRQLSTTTIKLNKTKQKQNNWFATQPNKNKNKTIGFDPIEPSLTEIMHD